MDTQYTDYAGSDIRWTCARKKRIGDEKQAKRLARHMTQANMAGSGPEGFRGVKVDYYGCTHCGGFHIGRVPG